MKRSFSYVLGILLTMVFIVAVFFTCLEYCAFDRNFYQAEYQKLRRPQVIGIEEDELMRVTDKLLGYMKGEEDDLSIEAEIMGHHVDVFAKRDRDHMVDVRDLYLDWALYRWIMFGAVALGILVIVLMMRREAPAALSKAYLGGTAIMLLLIAAVGAWVALDFAGFWTNFHYIFFTNDLWQLSPETSVLIQMVPEQFFFDIVVRILLFFAGALFAVAAVCAAVLIVRRNKRRAMMRTL